MKGKQRRDGSKVSFEGRRVSHGCEGKRATCVGNEEGRFASTPISISSQVSNAQFRELGKHAAFRTPA